MTTKEYISKETVLNILHDDYNETYFDEAIKNIESLPTFSPEKIIEKKNDM